MEKEGEKGERKNVVRALLENLTGLLFPPFLKQKAAPGMLFNLFLQQIQAECGIWQTTEK